MHEAKSRGSSIRVSVCLYDQTSAGSFVEIADCLTADVHQADNIGVIDTFFRRHNDFV